MEIYLIRHTTPQIEKGVCYGQSDIPLAGTFRSDIQKILPHLSDGVDIIYSSPLSRCLQLAEFINSTHHVTPDKRLMEMNFGNWEMKKWDEIDQRELNDWMVDFVNKKTPEGECFNDLHQRVKFFFDEKILSDPGKNNGVAIVTHGAVIRSVLCQILEIPLRNAFKIPIDYGGVTRINIDKKSCYQNIVYINKSFTPSNYTISAQ